MTTMAGPIRSVSINGRIFAVDTEADVARGVGEDEAEVLMNGDGSARKKAVPQPWCLEGVALAIDDDRKDQEFVREVTKMSGWVPIRVTMAGGTTYAGTGTIANVGKFMSMSQTQTVDLKGPGTLIRVGG